MKLVDRDHCRLFLPLPRMRSGTAFGFMRNGVSATSISVFSAEGLIEGLPRFLSVPRFFSSWVIKFLTLLVSRLILFVQKLEFNLQSRQ